MKRWWRISKEALKLNLALKRVQIKHFVFYFYFLGRSSRCFLSCLLLSFDRHLSPSFNCWLCLVCFSLFPSAGTSSPRCAAKRRVRVRKSWWSFSSGSATSTRCWTPSSTRTSTATSGRRSRTPCSAFSRAGPDAVPTARTTCKRIEKKKKKEKFVEICLL